MGKRKKEMEDDEDNAPVNKSIDDSDEEEGNAEEEVI